MRKILLSALCFLIFSISFSQKAKLKPDLKVNSVKTVTYLAKNLKLDDKQKAIVMNAYAEYAANVMKAHRKIKTKNVKTPANQKEIDSKKELNRYTMRFSVKRDEMVTKCLKKKQVAKYQKLVRDINPKTLEVKTKK